MRLPTLIVLGLLVIPCSSLADQTDPQLQALFATLKQSDDLNLLRITENRIWAIWLAHENPDVEQLIQLGNERMNVQNFPEALVIFNQVIENYPEYAEGWNRRATLFYLVGNLDASIADIEKTLALEPRHFGALSGLGLVYIQRDELSKARQAFESLIEFHPNSPSAQQNLESVKESLRLNII